MGSGAGLNRWSGVILTINPSAGIVAAPTVAYGILGVNDSFMVANEARDFTKPTFTLFGPDLTDYEVSLYGTNDPFAYTVWQQLLRGNKAYTLASVPPSSWKLLDGPADTAGAGSAANPVTAAAPILRAQGPWIAYRCALTAAGTGATAAANVSLEIAP